MCNCVYVGFQSYRDITLLNQDGMNNVLSVTNRMIYEKWIKLTDMCRTQVDLTFQRFFYQLCVQVSVSIVSVICIWPSKKHNGLCACETGGEASLKFEIPR